MMNYKQIIAIVAVILLALIIYKATSSNIQEEKEKAVLEYRFNVEQIPLEECLKDAEKANAFWNQLYMSTELWNSCVKEDTPESCRVGRGKVMDDQKQEDRERRDECYRRYK